MFLCFFERNFFFFILEYINAMARKISSEREGKKYKRYAYIFLYLCRFLSACSARYARRFIKLSRSIYKIYVYGHILSVKELCNKNRIHVYRNVPAMIDRIQINLLLKTKCLRARRYNSYTHRTCYFKKKHKTDKSFFKYIHVLKKKKQKSSR